ncbi:MAG: PemK-like, MazF-like toxin of type toxin-antitoxin system [Solirubrobacteraceae bacterium]|nr:PemK-like, MazF-like toxin of type toxin-antitoxin system [Solirubrobacteraceae bacterium]
MPADIDGLQTDSVVNVTQIATVDRVAVEDRIGALPDWLMAQIDAVSRAPSRSRASDCRGRVGSWSDQRQACRSAVGLTA